MRRATPAKGRPGKRPRGHYVLRLFIAGNGTNSQQALANLRRLCQEHLNGRSTIEIVDVVKDYQAAVRDNVLVTPALILVAPRPRVTILGNLSDSQKVLVALRLPGSES
jgi:circadian clock protein KaiB